MSVDIADILGAQIDLIARGIPQPIAAERRLFIESLDQDALDALDEDDRDEDHRERNRPHDDDADLVELFAR